MAMKERTYFRVLIAVVGLCLALTVAHLIYTVHAYQHCSIIYFISKELW